MINSSDQEIADQIWTVLLLKYGDFDGVIRAWMAVPSDFTHDESSVTLEKRLVQIKKFKDGCYGHCIHYDT